MQQRDRLLHHLSVHAQARPCSVPRRAITGVLASPVQRHLHCDNPLEGIWSLLKRSIASFVAADLDGLVRIIKRKLKKIQYRPRLINGCLATTGLTIEPW